MHHLSQHHKTLRTAEQDHLQSGGVLLVEGNGYLVTDRGIETYYFDIQNLRNKR